MMVETRNFERLSGSERDKITRDLSHSSHTAGTRYAKYFNNLDNAEQAHALYHSKIRNSPWQQRTASTSALNAEDSTELELAEPPDPRRSSRQHNVLFVVEKIVSHRASAAGSIELCVRWKDHVETTWEPIANLISLSIVHDYFIEVA
jgi:hypothetical protein